MKVRTHTSSARFFAGIGFLLGVLLALSACQKMQAQRVPDSSFSSVKGDLATPTPAPGPGVKYQLQIQIQGSGVGQVSATALGINCASNCM